MGSVITNWGKAFFPSVAMRGVDPGGNAPPASFYALLVVGASGSGYDFDNADPDDDDITDITGAVNPSNYSGNSLARDVASFTVTIDELTNDRGEIRLASPMQVTALQALSDIRGFVLTTANSVADAKVIGIFDLGQDADLSQGQVITLSEMPINGN